MLLTFQGCVHALLKMALEICEMEKKGKKLGEYYLNRTGVRNFLNYKMIVNYKNQEQQKNTFHFSSL